MYEIIPGAPAESVADATARLNIWHGPVRSSKTIHSLMAWAAFTQVAPQHGLLMMIGRTEEVLERNVLLPLSAMLGNQFWYSRGQHRARIGKRVIHLLGEADARAEEKVRGGTWSGFYRDEMSLGSPEFHRQCMARMSVEGARGFGTTNPDSPHHWLKREWIDRATELGIRVFHWPIEVNTYLPKSYIESLKAEYQAGSLWYKRFIEGLWVVAEGAVYDFWDEAKYTRPMEFDQFHELWVSADYGTGNPTVFGLFGVRRDLIAPRAGLLAEFYHSGREQGSKTDWEYAEALIDFLLQQGLNLGYVGKNPKGARVLRPNPHLGPIPLRGVILDPSAASFKAELKQRGVVVRDADNSVLDGIRTQARLLKTGEYAIDPGCKQTIRDYGAYLWDARAQAQGEDKPLKENDHTKDMERYALHTLFGGERAKGQRGPVNKPRGM